MPLGELKQLTQTLRVGVLSILHNLSVLKKKTVSMLRVIRLVKSILITRIITFNPKTGGYKEVGTPGTENLMERFPGHYEQVNGEVSY